MKIASDLHVKKQLLFPFAAEKEKEKRKLELNQKLTTEHQD